MKMMVGAQEKTSSEILTYLSLWSQKLHLKYFMYIKNEGIHNFLTNSFLFIFPISYKA